MRGRGEKISRADGEEGKGSDGFGRAETRGPAAAEALTLPAFFSLRPKLLFCRSFNIGVTKKEPSSISFLFKVSFWPAIAWRLTITHFTDIAVISILIFAAFKLHIFRCDKSTCQLCDTIRTRSHHRRSSIEILHSSTRIRNTCRD